MSVRRFEVRPADPRHDVVGQRYTRAARAFGFRAPESLTAVRLFYIDADADDAALTPIAAELLADPVTETARLATDATANGSAAVAIEVHLRPGVMDPVAASTLDALRMAGVNARAVRTAWRYEITGEADRDTLLQLARRVLANDCIEQIYVLGFDETQPPAGIPTAPVAPFELRHVPIRSLDDNALIRLSRDGHLFLSLEEMAAIRAHYVGRDREPTDLELETLAQTWSEHCVHKTLKSEIAYRGAPMPSSTAMGHRLIDDHTAEAHFDNLLKDTIAAATHKLDRPWCLSVFEDNAGVVAFDDQFGIAFKVETHNHPSAIEPYGGAATGIGGCIRDVIGCGLGAQPIANTDVFCFAPPDWPADKLPAGVLHPRSVMTGVVTGVRDYGNCMGIPTVNGAIHFDPRYLGNPLVYCGCVGLIPRNRIAKAALPGDAIVVVGGRTGRDGIHGATFSSAELTDTHADEFAHAVQIGNPITQKKLLDVILQARDHADGCLFSAITDCGAGGLSSAVGEMGAKTGATVDLERVPLKYEGLRYDEIWISEAQERMVLAVSPAKLDTVLALFANEDVEATVIGTFTDDQVLTVRYNGEIVGQLDMAFLHDGVPMTRKNATWQPPEPTTTENDKEPAQEKHVERIAVDLGIGTEHFEGETALEKALKKKLGSLNAASKAWVIRQYDHEVQSRSVVKPLVGPGEGPADAAVVRPRLDSNRGIAIGCGLCPQLSDDDPYWMAVAAVDEAIRNVVCVGGDPVRTAILDNFCWGRTDDPQQLGALVRACQGAHDAALAIGTPFISGKDSLNNEFAMDDAAADMLRNYLAQRAADFGVGPEAVRNNRLAIPGTLLISALSIVEDVRQCVTSDLKPERSDGSLLACWIGWEQADPNNTDVLHALADMHRFVHEAILAGQYVAAHDYCGHNLLAAVAEMAIGGQCGVMLQDDALADVIGHDVLSGYVVQLRSAADFAEWFAANRDRLFGGDGPSFNVGPIGGVDPHSDKFRIISDIEPEIIIDRNKLDAAWRSPLAW